MISLGISLGRNMALEKEGGGVQGKGLKGWWEGTKEDNKEKKKEEENKRIRIKLKTDKFSKVIVCSIFGDGVQRKGLKGWWEGTKEDKKEKKKEEEKEKEEKDRTQNW